MPDISDILYRITDTLQNLVTRVERLETYDQGGIITTNTDFPTKTFDGEIYRDIYNDIWIFDASITDSTHTTGRWRSQKICTSMQMVVGSGAGQTVSGTSTGTQVAFLAVDHLHDIYIYYTDVIATPATVNQDSTNHWTYYDDHVNVSVNGPVGSNYRIVLNTASVVPSTNIYYRIYVASTGSPGTLDTNGAVVHYAILA